MTATTLGRYTLLDALGSGSIAESYRAQTAGIEGFERSVVVKRLLPELRDDPYLIDSFLNTLRPTLALRHANIAQVLDMDLAPAASDGHYWVTEHVPGWSLRRLLTQCRQMEATLPVELALFIGLEASRALDYAHRLQPEEAIVHGNVSPSNLLLSREGEIKLTDFGSALSLLRRNAILGLPAQQGIPENGISLSPEQLEQGSATLHSDIFSLARTLVHCLQNGESEQLHASVPASISELLQRALSEDPSERVPTAADFYEQLMESMLKARLRWSRAAVLDWLMRTLRPESVSQKPEAQPVPPAQFVRATANPEPSPASTTPEASTPTVRDVSVLVVTLASEPSATLKLRITQVLQRAANGSHWVSNKQLCAVFQQPDGRDAEVAVRTALALLRALGTTSRSSNLAIDLTAYSASLFNADGDFTDPPVLAQWGQVLGQSDWQHAGRVVVSRQTTRELRALFRLKRVHKLGFAVVGSRRVDHASGPFFGRWDALSWLSNFTTALSSPGTTPPPAIAVIGNAGIGKTRLLLQLNDLLREANSTVRLCIAACPVRGRTLAYSAVLTLLARLCDIRDGDVAPRAQQSHPALVHVDAEDLARVTELLGDPPAPTDELDAELGALLTRVVVARATRCPQVLVLDAAHQMDDGSRRILARAVDGDLGKNALLVLLSRETSLLEELVPAVSNRWLLQPLDETTMSQILQTRLRITEVPAHIGQRFVELSQGNPLVLEELLRQALDQGQIRLGRDQLKAEAVIAPAPSRSLRLMQQSGLLPAGQSSGL